MFVTSVFYYSYFYPGNTKGKSCDLQIAHLIPIISSTMQQLLWFTPASCRVRVMNLSADEMSFKILQSHGRAIT